MTVETRRALPQSHSRTAPEPGVSPEGAARVAFADIAQQPTTEADIDSAATVIVCITCRRPIDPEDFPRPGLAFADAVVEAARNTGVRVKRVRCLANCKRGLSAAVRREAGWTYIFGDLDPATAAPALIAGARLFARADDGVMPWRGRPQPLKTGLIARVPPDDYEEVE
jgi:predicted metal-binding protein